jgi:hypothetical protein
MEMLQVPPIQLNLSLLGVAPGLVRPTSFIKR